MAGCKFSRTSFLRNIQVTIVLRKSATGKLYQTPFKPKNAGIINTRGIKNRPCLVSVRIKAGATLPVA
jgi:hypothetical protein